MGRRAATSIGRLVVRPPADATGPHLGRAWADRQLDGLDLVPAGLAPDAVLVVRSLSVVARPGWQGEARRLVARLVGSAARPFLDLAGPDDARPIPFSAPSTRHIEATVPRTAAGGGRAGGAGCGGAGSGGAGAGSGGAGSGGAGGGGAGGHAAVETQGDAPAVLFADEPELLACLTVDIASGRVADRWWWRRLGVPAPSGAPGRALASAWSARAASLPAALARLPRATALYAVALLSHDEARQVAAAVAGAWRLPSRPAVDDLLDLCLVLHHAPATALTQSPAPVPDTVEGPAPLHTDGVATRVGGVLYLLHVLEWLAFPWGWSDEAAAVLGGWGSLEAVGRVLAADADDDPLWSVLADLAGRPDDVVLGHGLAPPEVAPDPPEDVQPRLDQYGIDAHPTPLPVAVEMSEGAAYWAGRVGALADALLAASGCGRSVLDAPGMVVAGRTHVDLYLGLDAVNLAARVAGLDRDPGWMPAFGRIVQFHFGESAGGHA